MSGPDSPFRRRRTIQSTSSTYSFSSSASHKASSDGWNSVMLAARSLAGAIVPCFANLKNKSSSDAGYGDEIRICYGSGSKREGRLGNSNSSIHMRKAGSVKFTMAEIYEATHNFSPTCKIGQGGFGTVYRGRLEDGTTVAVKRAKKNIRNEHLEVEFQSEIQTLAQVEHLNLVKFYGYLEHEDERIIVVEYVPNGSLREHLDCVCGIVLDLAARLNIAVDVAHAVTYLHMYTDHPIIHGDIKSSNILLTENRRAKVSDFGFAQLAADCVGGSHLSTIPAPAPAPAPAPVKGTVGYLDHEYLRTYQLTDKSDVYSFGVVLVELVTGRRSIEPKRELEELLTAEWAMKKFVEGDGVLILDPRLERTAASNLASEKILELALNCLAPARQSRPSMKTCAEVLWGIRKDYSELLSSDFCLLSWNSCSSISTRKEVADDDGDYY